MPDPHFNEEVAPELEAVKSNKTLIVAIVRPFVYTGLIVAVVAAASYWTGRRSSSSPPAYVCTNPGPNELCATDQWYESYQQFDALNSEIAKDQKSPAITALQKKMDQALGMQDRLKQMMPCFQFAPDGKTCMVPSVWSLAKKRFVKAPSTTFPVTPAVIPTPAK